MVSLSERTGRFSSSFHPVRQNDIDAKERATFPFLLTRAQRDRACNNRGQPDSTILHEVKSHD